MALSTFAAERRAADAVGHPAPTGVSIDITCPYGAQQQTRRTPLRYIDPAPHVGNANNLTVTPHPNNHKRNPNH